VTQADLLARLRLPETNPHWFRQRHRHRQSDPSHRDPQAVAIAVERIIELEPTRPHATAIATTPMIEKYLG
jgi:hypothetical protein